MDLSRESRAKSGCKVTLEVLKSGTRVKGGEYLYSRHNDASCMVYNALTLCCTTRSTWSIPLGS